jgi:O-antigen ligase
MIEAALPIVALGAAAVAMLLFFRPAYVTIMFGLALPLGAVDIPGGVALSIAMSILVIAIAVIQRLQRGLLPLPPSWPTLMALVWSIGIVFSVLLGPDLITAATFGAWQIVSFLFAICWAEVAGRAQIFAKAVGATLIGATIVALTGPLMATGEVEAAFGGAVVSNRPMGVFSQPNEYGLFNMLVVVFAFGIAAGARGWLRHLAIVAVLASSVGLLLSLSRGAWVGAAGGMVALLILMPQARRVFVVGAGALLAAFVAVLMSPVQIPYLSVIVSRALTITEESTNPYDSRVQFRAEGMRQWNEAPFFGQGPNMYPQLSQGIDSVARPGGAEHPHTLLLAIGSEQGLIGVAALVGLAGSVVMAGLAARKSLLLVHRFNAEVDGNAVSAAVAGAEGARAQPKRRLPSMATVVAASAAASFAGLIVEGMIDFPIRNPLSRTTVFLIIGWALAAHRLMRIEQAAARGSTADNQPAPGSSGLTTQPAAS